MAASGPSGTGRHTRNRTQKGASEVTNNLTRDEARERRRLLQVSSYQVDLDLTGSADTFRSCSTVRFGCTSPGARSFIELTAPAVHEIVLNGTAVPRRPPSTATGSCWTGWRPRTSCG